MSLLLVGGGANAAAFPKNSDDMIAIEEPWDARLGPGGSSNAAEEPPGRSPCGLFVRALVALTRCANSVGSREVAIVHGVSGKSSWWMGSCSWSSHVDGWSQPALYGSVSKPPNHADCAKAEASVCARLAKPSQHGQIGTNKMEAVEQSVGF